MQYPHHAAFVAPAQSHPQIWRLLLGIFFVLTIYVLWILGTFAVIAALTGLDGAQQWMGRVMRPDGGPTATLILLSTFIGMGLGVFVTVSLLHHRRFAGLFGPRKRTYRQFGIGFLVCAAIYAALMALPTEMAPQPNLEFRLWIGFLPLALLAILIQTGAEEVLFRGYIQQQLAARFSSVWVWMVLPSALFAIGHYDPDTFGSNGWIVVAVTFFFGICAADLTAKTGSIGAAWGFHFANNVVAILIVSLEGPLSGLALYTQSMDQMSEADLRPLLILDAITTLVTWALIRFAVTRRAASPTLEN